MSLTEDRTAKRPCALPRRMASMLYDALVVLALWMVGGAVVVLPAGGAIESGSPTFQLYLLGLAFGYFWISWSYAGQTLGMRAWRIRLDPRGRSFGPDRALLRFAGAVAAAAPAGLGYLWALGRSDQAAWPDLISDSRLVVEGA